MGNWSPRQQKLVRGLILVAIVELIVRVHPCYFVTLELALHCQWDTSILSVASGGSSESVWPHRLGYKELL